MKLVKQKNILTFGILLLFALIACNSSSNKSGNSDKSNDFGNHKVVVKDVIQASNYTYLEVNEDDKDYWMAVSKQDIDKGATLYYRDALPMSNFESKDLQRTFDLIYFVQDIGTEPILPKPAQNSSSDQNLSNMQTPQKPVLEKINVQIDHPGDVVKIGDLYADREKYEGKTIKVKGMVTKVNPQIMDRNWIHLQDGTMDGDNFDLTVTTNDDIQTGNVIVFEGTIALNKDFGMGYSYEVIMEGAKTVQE